MAAPKRKAAARPAQAAASTKRTRSSLKEVPKEPTPVREPTPVVEIVEEEEKPEQLPNKIFDSKPLPTLREPQAIGLSDEEYQSVANSAILLSSIERSRQKWVGEGIFERYWVKTSTRKDAPPPPPNNPQKSWMKDIGQVTITIEPLVLEATAFYSKEPGVHTAVQYPQPPQQRPPQYGPAPGNSPAASSPYGTPYRPQPQPQHQTPPQGGPPYYQARTLPPVNHQRPGNPPNAQPPDNRILPPIHTPQSGAGRGSLPPPPHAQPTTGPPSTPKPSPDPVIQMLATRASTDSELKALMKIVATGNANQEQLKIFQRHIDELTSIIQSQKTGPNGTASPAANQNRPPVARSLAAPAPPTGDGRNHGSPMTPGNQTPQQHFNHSNRPPFPHQMPAPRPPMYGQYAPPHQQHYPVPVPSMPVVFEFHGPGASPDRFRFPPYSILEQLAPHTLLASFLIIRKGKEAANSTGLDPETEYYQPITLRLDVTDRYPNLLEFVKRSVKPPDEVRKWMEEKMKSCTRAEQRYLPLRLPHKSQIEETEEVGPEPVTETKPRAKKVTATEKKEKDDTPKPVEPKGTESDVPDGRRRSLKKSVRISEAQAQAA
ncbi:hypothetical protein M8818_007062 [Zalaria obscura]|uniref:Uncharacterized protein n=1 Tax=Zalaria obscura TaxID=2024903 RepID=A0ACC3S5T1_9PEZI